MGKNSHIEWTNHTFNPWWGCEKVSPACKHCYAEAWAKRVGKNIWGPKAPRRFFSESHWGEPTKWNAEAQSRNARARVFCASMADVFEDRSDLVHERSKLWDLIESTPSLDWLLLTKRPQLVAKLVPWRNSWPDNVWLGTTAENQSWANKRLPWILDCPAKVRFLSCEPLLGEIDLTKFAGKRGSPLIHWVIAGGESGPHSRPMNPAWVRRLRDFCHKRHIAFHFKQWGHWAPLLPREEAARRTINITPDQTMIALGKGAAGRLLDGTTHDELPMAV